MNSGYPSASADASTDSGSSSQSFSCVVSNGPTGSPACRNSCFWTSLAIPIADAENPGADVGHARELEEPLDRSVFAERTVQDREHDIDRLAGSVCGHELT